jgi:hypothetical protein
MGRTPHEVTCLREAGPPPLIEGEDAAAYDELLVRISAAVKPADILEDIWVREIVDLVWSAFRLRRFKTSPINWVNDILASAGRTTNGIGVRTLSVNLDHVERIEHMIAMDPPQRDSARDRPPSENARPCAATGRAPARARRNSSNQRYEIGRGEEYGVTSERKISANHANARASTGPKTAARSRRRCFRTGRRMPAALRCV